MINKSVDYCVNSTDPTCYNRLRVCLPAPTTEYCKLQVTTLTTQTEMIILDRDDYIEVEYSGREKSGEAYTIKYTVLYEYKEMSAGKLVGQLNNMVNSIIKKLKTIDQYKTVNLDLQFELDMVDRMKICSKYHFRIIDVSYRLRILLGMYNVDKIDDWYYESQGDINVEKDKADGSGTEIKQVKKYYKKMDSVGYYLSTPVLYLIANVGEQCYRTTQGGKVRSNRVMMKINNSFSSGCAMICSNSEFETMVNSGMLSNLEFTLVDAYMREVKLLTPMYLTIHVDAVVDKETLTPYHQIPKGAFSIGGGNKAILGDEQMEKYFTELKLREEGKILPSMQQTIQENLLIAPPPPPTQEEVLQMGLNEEVQEMMIQVPQAIEVPVPQMSYRILL